HSLSSPSSRERGTFRSGGTRPPGAVRQLISTLTTANREKTSSFKQEETEVTEQGTLCCLLFKPGWVSGCRPPWRVTAEEEAKDKVGRARLTSSFYFAFLLRLFGP
ncbi:MAG: hypothetical protein ACOYOU_13065, partial [Kiritimatiellia bacterium]